MTFDEKAMRSRMMFAEKAMMTNPRRWPGETLCLKRPREAITAEFSERYGVITSNQEPVVVYLRGETEEDDFKRTKIYDTFDELIEDGWVVD